MMQQTLCFDMNLQIKKKQKQMSTKATSDGVPSRIGEWKVFDTNGEELTELKALRGGMKVSSCLNCYLALFYNMIGH